MKISKSKLNTLIYVKYMFAVLFAIISFLFSIASASIYTANAAYSHHMRIGLKYTEGPVLSANTFSEYGFIFGYFTNDDFNFVTIYETSERFISGTVDKNLFKNGNTLYTSGSGTSIGAWHIELSAAYNTYNDAVGARDNYKKHLTNTNIFVAYVDSIYKLRVGEYTSEKNAINAITSVKKALSINTNPTVVGEISNVITVVNMNTGSVMFEFDCSSSSGKTFAVKPRQKAGEATAYLKHGNDFYRGYFEYKKLGTFITFVNTIELDDYLKGVLPYEIYTTWPEETMKAQAVASRSYALYSGSRHKNTGYIVCNTTHCQMYKGIEKESTATNNAVDKTSHEILTIDGKVCESVFFAISGGYTESGKNAWGSEISYLQAVPDPFEASESVSNGTWTSEATAAQIGELLRSKGKSFSGQARNLYVNSYTDASGNVFEISAVDANNNTVSYKNTDSVRIAFSKYVKSPRFIIRKVYSDGTVVTSESSSAEKTRDTIFNRLSSITIAQPISSTVINPTPAPTQTPIPDTIITPTPLPDNFILHYSFFETISEEGSKNPHIQLTTAITANGETSNASSIIEVINKDCVKIISVETGELLGVYTFDEYQQLYPQSNNSQTQSHIPLPETETKPDNYITVPAMRNIVPAVTVEKKPSANAYVTKYIFIGSGWGHSVGMSQYGALGMARAGYDYKSILYHYFTGVTIEKITD